MPKKEKSKNRIPKILSKKVDRREFIKKSVLGLGSLAVALYGFNSLLGSKSLNSLLTNTSKESDKMKLDSLKEAMFYEKYDFGVKCLLCPRECFLQEGSRGICRVRENHNNTLYSLVYGKPVALHIDPIEKKPLFHFYPESAAFSIATAGCNLRCLNCQNWEISQSNPEDLQSYNLSSQQVVEEAAKNNCTSIAYTYSEPIVFYEYTYDIAKLAREQGIKNVLISAGYINEKPLRTLTKFLDAANIDLKSFSNSTYQKLNGGTLDPVLRTLKVLNEEGVWLEITNLIIPNWTDDLDMIKKMAKWLYDNGFENTPLHFSRFHPEYKLQNVPPTPVETLTRARKIALEQGLKFVYIGNVPGHDGEHTYCPNCNKLLIERKGFLIIQNHIKNGKCEYCNTEIPGRW